MFVSQGTRGLLKVHVQTSVSARRGVGLRGGRVGQRPVRQGGMLRGSLRDGGGDGCGERPPAGISGTEPGWAPGVPWRLTGSELHRGLGSMVERGALAGGRGGRLPPRRAGADRRVCPWG